MSLNESIVEDAALEWFGELGYAVGHGAAFAGLRRAKPPLAPVKPAAEWEPERSGDSRRQSFGEVVLVGRLREAIRGLNPAIPPSRTLATLRDTLLPKLLSGELQTSAST
jgi:type I restriction enzyme R subunit